MKRMNRNAVFSVTSIVLTSACGCGLGLSGLLGADRNAPSGPAAGVAQRALEVGGLIGGVDGFGGVGMNGYLSHMPAMMGFWGVDDLADPESPLRIEFTNESAHPCTFFVSYLAGVTDDAEQSTEVEVPSGETVTVEMACAEILGLGSLTEVGAVAAELDDGLAFDNRMCVPGFLGTDFLCGGSYYCGLAPDAQDVDQDGDTEELVVTTEALKVHLGARGMMGHGHRNALGPGMGMGMMGKGAMMVDRQ